MQRALQMQPSSQFDLNLFVRPIFTEKLHAICKSIIKYGVLLCAAFTHTSKRGLLSTLVTLVTAIHKRGYE